MNIDARSPEQKFVKAPVSKRIPAYLSQQEKNINPYWLYNVDKRQKLYNDTLQRLEDWIRSFVDFSAFPHRYITQGASEAIIAWSNEEKRRILTLEQDYTWIKSFPKVSAHSGLKAEASSIFYLSQPFFSDGNYAPFLEQAASMRIPIALDLTWLGCSKPRNLPIPSNVEFVFFSLSKSWGTWPWRVGFLFSKTPFRCFDLYKEAGYFSQVTIHIVELLTNEFKFQDQYDFFKPLQEKICAAESLIPSEAYLIGINSVGKKVSLTDQFQKINSVNELYI